MTQLGGQIAVFLDHLIVERALAKNSILSYRRDLDKYHDFLAGNEIDDLVHVTSQQVADFLVYLHTEYQLKATSAARAIIAVRGLHKFLSEEGILPSDVAEPISPPKTGQNLPKALSITEVESILEASGNSADMYSAKHIRDRALLELLYSSGARISEIISLDVDDIDSDSRLITVTGKGGKQRIVPIGTPAYEALTQYLTRSRPGLNSQGNPALFLNQRGGRLSRQSSWEILRVAAEQAGITKEVSPHTLRHCFATHLLDGGADIRVVQELLGHASVTTTQIYTLVTVNTLREVFATSHPRAH